jgi:hypothetical protein
MTYDKKYLLMKRLCFWSLRTIVFGILYVLVNLSFDFPFFRGERIASAVVLSIAVVIFSASMIWRLKDIQRNPNHYPVNDF